MKYIDHTIISDTILANIHSELCCFFGKKHKLFGITSNESLVNMENKTINDQ